MYPVLFEIGSLKVYTYGLMMAVGILAGIIVARKFAPQIGIDPEKITDLAMFAVLGGLLGSYVNYIISYDWSEFKADPLSVRGFGREGWIRVYCDRFATDPRQNGLSGNRYLRHCSALPMVLAAHAFRRLLLRRESVSCLQ